MKTYIDKDKAIKAVQSVLYEAFNRASSLAAATFDKLPAEDVAPVVYAELVPSGRFGAVDPLCQRECSSCGCGHMGIVYYGKQNFCPNCGAKLIGVKEPSFCKYKVVALSTMQTIDGHWVLTCERAKRVARQKRPCATVYDLLAALCYGCPDRERIGDNG